MKTDLMTLVEVARYLNVAPLRLVRAYCNRGSLAGVPLPEALDDAPLRQRHWSRAEISQFRDALRRAQHGV